MKLTKRLGSAIPSARRGRAALRNAAGAMLCVALALVHGLASAEIYRWVDTDGKPHFSDKPPERQAHEVVDLPALNIEMSNRTPRRTTRDEPFKKDDFQLPYTRSKVAHRFALSSRIKDNKPVDRLGTIEISDEQLFLVAYVQLIQIARPGNYRMQLRILDAKGELLSHGDRTVHIKFPTSTLFIYSKFHPNRAIDEPGMWTFQGILDKERLFVEKRLVTFAPDATPGEFMVPDGGIPGLPPAIGE